MTQSQPDFEHLRLEMVETQLRERGITNERLLDIMEHIQRHIFVSEKYQVDAYEDKPLPIPCGQTISQPYMVAVMTELLELHTESKVLEIGTGSGYQAAILGRLVKSVISIERHEALAALARKLLQSISVDNVIVQVGDGTLGTPEQALFDSIIVTAGGPNVPKSLMNQLVIGGRMVCPVGNRKSQKLIVVIRHADGYKKIKNTKCRFVPLIGLEGWST